jgi:predicted permease
MKGFLLEIRDALRLVRRAPALTVAIAGSLALGIGANTAVFSFVNAIQFKPLPFADEATLVDVSEWSSTDLCAGCGVGTSLPSFLEWRDRARSFSAVEAYREQSFVVSGGADAERTGGAIVSSGLFPMIGVQPALGRGLRAEEDVPGASPVVLISHRLWTRRLESRSEVVGSTIKVDGVARTIVGVMPPGFAFPEFAQLWVPLQQSGTEWPGRDRSLGVVARLRPGTRLEEARSEMRAIAAARALAHPETNARWTARVTSLREDMTGETSQASLVLLVAVTIVLLIACANVANLLLARAVERRREIAIRMALGASRARVARLVWTESLTLSALGGALGMLLALWASRWLVSSFAVEAPYWIEFGMDWRVPIYCGAVTVATALMSGLAPAFQASKRDVRATLQDGANASAGRTGRRFRHTLVVVQLALSLVLLAGAGLMTRTLVRAYQFDIGYDPSRLLVGDLTLNEARYDSPAAIRGFATSLVESLERMPSVRAAISHSIFFAGFGGQPRRLIIDGAGEAPAGASPGFYHAVTPGYFATLGVAILEGRDFTAADAGHVVIVNRELADRIWGPRSPLGARIRFGADRPWLSIVAVVANIGGSPMGARRAAYAYVPFAGNEGTSLSVSVRGAGEVSALAPEVRAAAARIDPDVPVEDLMTTAAMLDRWTQPARFVALLLLSLSAAAVLLASMGTYGVMAYGVAQRTREIGIRLALGAGAHHIRQLLVGAGLRLVAAGLVLGLLLAWLCTRALTGILAGTSPTDPVVFALVASILGTVGLIASWIPSRRALTIDPTIALRAE